MTTPQGGKRNVAYLTGQFPRVTDTWIRREMAGLERRGIDVQAFSIRKPEPDVAVDIDRDTTYVLDLARSGRLVGASFRMLTDRPGPLLAATRLAWSTRRPGFKGTLYQLFYLVEAVVLADELRRRRIKHLHNHLADSSCTVAMLASTISGIPYSFTIHGAAIFYQAPTWRLDEKARRAAFVVAISNFARSQLAVFADAADYDKFHVVHCGVEPNLYEGVGSRGDGGQLIFVGRLVTNKGLTVLLRALEQLNTSPLKPELQLTVAGDGPDRQAFEQQVDDLGLAGQVSFTGPCSPEAVAALLADADIFVLPSFAEGVPVVLMEAMAAELPVVTTNIAGVPELVADNESGLLVAPTDVDGLANAVIRLAADPALRAQLGSAGRKKVLSEFDSDTEAGKLAELILTN